MTAIPDPIAVALLVADALDTSKVRYTIGGPSSRNFDSVAAKDGFIVLESWIAERMRMCASDG